MPTVRPFRNAQEFLNATGDWLHHEEAQNNIFIGIAETLRLEPERVPTHPCFHAVFDDQSGVECVAVHLPPHGLAISQASDEAVGALVRFFSECSEKPEHVRAPAVVATGFADAWQEQHGQAKTLFMKTRLYECREVVAPRECDGAMRPAAQDEVDLLAEWQQEFYREAWTGDRAWDSCRRSVTQAIKSQRVYVWDAGETVSVLLWAGETPNGARINQVYTPVQHRGHGYGSNLTAAVTQLLLDRGKQFMVLFTDAANATTNRIYQEIGYRPTSDWEEWMLA